LEKLSRAEQESILIFDRESPTAEVYTHEPRLIKKLKQFAREYPDLCKHESTNEYGGAIYTFPKKYIRIGLPRVKKD
jgi:hypothetical protein